LDSVKLVLYPGFRIPVTDRLEAATVGVISAKGVSK